MADDATLVFELRTDVNGWLRVWQIDDADSGHDTEFEVTLGGTTYDDFDEMLLSVYPHQFELGHADVEVRIGIARRTAIVVAQDIAARLNHSRADRVDSL